MPQDAHGKLGEPDSSPIPPARKLITGPRITVAAVTAVGVAVVSLVAIFSGKQADAPQAAEKPSSASGFDATDLGPCRSTTETINGITDTRYWLDVNFDYKGHRYRTGANATDLADRTAVSASVTNGYLNEDPEPSGADGSALAVTHYWLIGVSNSSRFVETTGNGTSGSKRWDSTRTGGTLESMPDEQAMQHPAKYVLGVRVGDIEGVDNVSQVVAEQCTIETPQPNQDPAGPRSSSESFSPSLL